MSLSDEGAGCLGIIGIVIAVLGIFLLGSIFWGWIIMLAVGASHSIWGWPASTIGLWWAGVGLGALFSIIIGGIKGSS